MKMDDQEFLSWRFLSVEDEVIPGLLQLDDEALCQSIVDEGRICCGLYQDPVERQEFSRKISRPDTVLRQRTLLRRKFDKEAISEADFESILD